MEAGETVQIVQWDHDLATFVPMGRGTVSEDRAQIITDVGSGISKAGWGGCVGPDCPLDPAPQCVFGGPTCRGAFCGCNSCQMQSPTTPNTCPICITDPLKEGFACEDNKCKACTGGACAQKFDETVNQSISAPYFEDVVPIQTNLPVGGGFKTKGQTLSFITQAPQGEYKAKWEIKFLAHCAAEGKWKFAIKSANFTSVVLYDQNNIDEFPTSIIQSANCQATKDIEFAFHNGSLV